MMKASIKSYLYLFLVVFAACTSYLLLAHSMYDSSSVQPHELKTGSSFSTSVTETQVILKS